MPIGDLPGILAIPLAEYECESHPVMRLHRMCDAVEVLTRFLAIVALAEVRAAQGQELPDSLLTVLQPLIPSRIRPDILTEIRPPGQFV